MKLKTKDLKTFLTLSSAVSGNSILPVHKYLKLEQGKLQKTIGSKFICHEIDAPLDLNILLEEMSFSAFVKLTREQEITVTISDVKDSEEKKVVLSDGKMKQSFQVPPITLFDMLPEFNDTEAIDFDSEILQSVGISAKCVGEVGGGSNVDFVYLQNGFIYGTDKQRVYSKRFNNIPSAYFDKDSANVISQFDNVSYCQSSDFNLFKVGKTLYGFKQYGGVKPLDIRVLIDRKLEGDYFEFDTADVLQYCELVSASIQTNGKDVVECMIDGGELTCISDEYGKEVKMTIEFEGKYQAKLKFNPKQLAPYLRALGMSRIRFYDFSDAKGNRIGFYLSDPDDITFVGMVAGLN